MDLFNQIQELTEKLNTAIKSLAKKGQELAETERDYKITLRQEALKLRAEKGMPVTLIQQVVYGVPEVAEKRFKRDVAETMYQTNQEYRKHYIFRLSLPIEVSVWQYPLPSIYS